MHKDMIRDRLTSQVVFNIENIQIETSSEMGGLVSMIMYKKIPGRIYLIRGADIIRAGEMLGFDDENE